MYSTLTLLGGIAHDFVPSLARALLPGPSRTAALNTVFVKLGWAWNLALLVPLVALASHAFRGLAAVQLDSVEASIEAYHERRLKQLAQASAASNSVSGSGINSVNGPANFSISAQSSPPPAKTIVTLQSLSQSSSANASANAVEAYQKRILDEDEHAKSSAGKVFPKLKTVLSMIICTDLLRLVVCSFFYYLATSAFLYIGGGGNGGKNINYKNLKNFIFNFLITLPKQESPMKAQLHFRASSKALISNPKNYQNTWTFQGTLSYSSLAI